jgi:hypothetical protein
MCCGLHTQGGGLVSNLLQTGIEWLADRLGESASTTAVYCDRSDIETPITVSLGVETTQIDNTSDITFVVRQIPVVITNQTVAIDTSGIVLLGSVEWSIVSIECKHANLTVATCERRELLEMGRPNMRRR